MVRSPVHFTPTQKAPGRKGMSWKEEDWVDADAVSHWGYATAMD